MRTQCLSVLTASRDGLVWTLSPRSDEVFIRPPSATQLPTLRKIEARSWSGCATAYPVTSSKVGGSTVRVWSLRRAQTSLRFHQTLLDAQMLLPLFENHPFLSSQGQARKA